MGPLNSRSTASPKRPLFLPALIPSPTNPGAAAAAGVVTPPGAAVLGRLQRSVRRSPCLCVYRGTGCQTTPRPLQDRPRHPWPQHPTARPPSSAGSMQSADPTPDTLAVISVYHDPWTGLWTMNFDRQTFLCLLFSRAMFCRGGPSC